MPAFVVPFQPAAIAFNALPVMGANNGGCMLYCYNGRKPGEPVNGGTGVPVFWMGNPANTWISVCTGQPVTA